MKQTKSLFLLIITFIISTVSNAEIYLDSAGKSRLALSSQGLNYVLGDSSRIEETPCGGSGTIPQTGFYHKVNQSTITEFDPTFGVWHHCLSGVTNLIHWGLAGDLPAAADYDGNSITDYAVFRPSEGKFYIAFNSVGGVLTGATSVINFGLKYDTPYPIDIDNDGVDNIAIFRRDTASGELQFLYRDNLGVTSKISFGLLNDVPVPRVKDSLQRNIIAIFRPSSGEWFLRSFTGATSSFLFGLPGDIPLSLPYLSGLDFTPVLYRPREASWYTKNGSTVSRISFGTLGSKVSAQGILSTYLPEAPGDVDGDFLSDLSVVRKRSTSSVQVLSYRFSNLSIPNAANLVNAFTIGGTNSATNNTSLLNGLVSLDFDGDKRTDFGSVREDQGVIKWQLSLSSTKKIKTLTEYQFGLTKDTIYPGDYDGDARADLGIVRDTLSENGITYKTWYVNPSSGNTISPYQWGFSGDKLFLGDMDGDRKVDSTVIRNTPNGLLWVTRLASGESMTPLLFGVSGDKTHLMDLNGDGRVEPVIERESSGKLFFYSSAISSSFSTASVQWGVSGDTVISGIERGLRRGSIGVWRIVNGQGYFFIRNLDSDPASSIIPFGVRGDIPVVKGFVDLAAFTTTTSTTNQELPSSQNLLILNQSKRIICNSYPEVSTNSSPLLWKPVSDANGKLVLLYAKGKFTSNSKLYLVNQGVDQDVVLERLVYFGNQNDGRGIFRAKKSGADYPSPIILVKQDSVNAIECVRILNPGLVIGR